jgi:SAM-dependent methyltransferase
MMNQFKEQKSDNHSDFLLDCQSAVLLRKLESREAVETINSLGFQPHHDLPKNWDSLKTLSFICRCGGFDSVIADMGCAHYGKILFWLRGLGYKNLHGCDLSFKESFKKSGINFSPQNIEKTNFKDNCFDFMSCLSVIEHGVNLKRFFAECRRTIRQKGFLLISADYWHESLATYQKHFDEEFKCYVKVFNRSEIESIIQLGKTFGFSLIGDPDLTCNEKVVYWKKMDLHFTFIFLAFQLSK